MAITIPSTKTGGLTGLRGRSQTGSTGSAELVQKAERRIAPQRESTPVRLSSVGMTQSALAELQTASLAVSESKPSTSDADLRKQADTFVRTFNSAVEATRTPSPARGAVTESGHARAAEAELRRSVETLAASADLRKAGIAPQEGGTLSIDSKLFNAALGADREALRTELSRIGRQVEQTASGQLNIDRAIKPPGEAARATKTSRNGQQELATAARQTVSAQADRFNNNLPSGAAAYQRVFSL